MSSLRSAIDELALEEPGAIPTSQLGDDIQEIVRARNRLDAQLSRRVGEFDRRQGHVGDGAVSTGSWLRWKTGMSEGGARRSVKVSRDLTAMPATSEAFESGDLDTTRVAMLADARRADPEAFAATETSLVDAAVTQSHGNLRKVIAYWRQAVDGPGELEREERLHGQRRLDISSTLDGMVRIDAQLDPESGQIVLTAINSLAEPWGKDGDDPRTPKQRRADALTEISRDALDHKDLPTRGGRKPHVDVVVSLEALEGRLGHRAEIGDTVITPETARRLLCDAAVSRIVTVGDSQILDVGRSTRTIPAAIRRAVEVRDRQCRAKGCDRPPRWCDVHHLDHWADGGETKVERLVLLCRFHHRLIHLGLIELDPPPPALDAPVRHISADRAGPPVPVAPASGFR
jgi:hypothetical protein